MTPKTAEDRMRYAKRNATVFWSGPDQLLQLKPDKRIHAMKALSCLAKFTGKYDQWMQLRQRYGLKWTSGSELLDTLSRFSDDSKTLDAMIEWLRQSRQSLPREFGDALLFCTLTGLRASECVDCIRLIRDPEQSKTYYHEGRHTLEHFRFPGIFIRRTKVAYISVVGKEILRIAQGMAKTLTYQGLKMACRHRSLDMRMKYCRKIFASRLRQSGIESEIVDMLGGRVPKSIFARHYFRPSQDYRERVLQALSELSKKLDITI
jgi:hypothetical protein